MHLPRALHRHPRAGRAHGARELREHLTRPRGEPSTFRVENTTRGTVLATRCKRADSFLARGIGLIGRAGLREGEGLLIARTSSITMFFMRFAIDAVFLDRDGRVVRAVERLRPWTPASWAPGGRDVLELPAGTVERTRTQAGDVIRTG